jgi:hypothetical protein
LTILRRFLVLAALFFWQGGLTFYGAVVIPIGAHLLGSHREQAVITREVVPIAGAAGLVALVLFFWDVLATRDPQAWRRLCRQGLAMAVAVTWVVLFCLQLLLDQRFDAESRSVEDLSSFRELHSLYLWIFTAQWGACLLFLLTGLQAWRAADQDVGEQRRSGAHGATSAPHFQVLIDESTMRDEVVAEQAEDTEREKGEKKFRR